MLAECMGGHKSSGKKQSTEGLILAVCGRIPDEQYSTLSADLNRAEALIRTRGEGFWDGSTLKGQVRNRALKSRRELRSKGE